MRYVWEPGFEVSAYTVRLSGASWQPSLETGQNSISGPDSNALHTGHGRAQEAKWGALPGGSGGSGVVSREMGRVSGKAEWRVWVERWMERPLSS